MSSAPHVSPEPSGDSRAGSQRLSELLRARRPRVARGPVRTGLSLVVDEQECGDNWLAIKGKLANVA